jgi:hypothetical protein
LLIDVQTYYIVVVYFKCALHDGRDFLGGTYRIPDTKHADAIDGPGGKEYHQYQQHQNEGNHVIGIEPDGRYDKG